MRDCLCHSVFHGAHVYSCHRGGSWKTVSYSQSVHLGTCPYVSSRTADEEAGKEGFPPADAQAVQKEQKELIGKLEDLTTKSNKYKTQFDRIKEFREVADKYLNFTELTNEIVHSLIDHIEIDVNTINNKKIKEINIIYRFIC